MLAKIYLGRKFSGFFHCALWQTFFLLWKKVCFNTNWRTCSREEIQAYKQNEWNQQIKKWTCEIFLANQRQRKLLRFWKTTSRSSKKQRKQLNLHCIDESQSKRVLSEQIQQIHNLEISHLHRRQSHAPLRRISQSFETNVRSTPTDNHRKMTKKTMWLSSSNF